jgi:hypothetical protein
MGQRARFARGPGVRSGDRLAFGLHSCWSCSFLLARILVSWLPRLCRSRTFAGICGAHMCGLPRCSHCCRTRCLLRLLGGRCPGVGGVHTMVVPLRVTCCFVFCRFARGNIRTRVAGVSLVYRVSIHPVHCAALAVAALIWLQPGCI